MGDPREVLQADALEGVPHGFLTGIGHEGEPDAGLIMPGGELVLLRQVHSPDAIVVDAPLDPRPEADALATATPGLVLGIVTADCAPVLLADPQAGVIGAAHAGWRGAHGGVIGGVVAAMESLGAQRSWISAAIGPTIQQDSYEVDAGFLQSFDSVDAHFFDPGREGHWQFNLPAYVAHRLRESGVAQIEDLALDTYTQPARFHSYRRATHLGQPTYGRQFSLISLPQH